jgi:hypothetical protein
MNTRDKDLDVRSFETPDETMPGERSAGERVNVGGVDVWRLVFEPGWRLIDETDGELCAAPHAGYVASGTLRARMEDGTEAEASPGEVMVLPPGHDAWTVGDETCVFIDFGQGVDFGASGP